MILIPDWNLEHIVGVTPEFIELMKIDEVKYAKLQKAYKSLYRLLDTCSDNVSVEPIAQAGHIYVITFVIEGSFAFIPSEDFFKAVREAFEDFYGVSVYPRNDGNIAVAVTIEDVYGTAFKKHRE